MKGLLLKDLTVLMKQTRIFLILMAGFCCIPRNLFFPCFVVLYTGMLVISSMSFDEGSKWSLMAAMMPYSPTALVMEKYVLGLLLVGIAGAWGLLAQSIFAGQDILVTAFGIGAAVCVTLLLLSIQVPLMHRFGVEKARLIIILGCGALGAGSALLGNLVDNLDIIADAPWMRYVAFLLPAATVVCLGISVWVSVRLYRRKIKKGLL